MEGSAAYSLPSHQMRAPYTNSSPTRTTAGRSRGATLGNVCVYGSLLRQAQGHCCNWMCVWCCGRGYGLRVCYCCMAPCLVHPHPLLSAANAISLLPWQECGPGTAPSAPAQLRCRRCSAPTAPCGSSSGSCAPLPPHPPGPPPPGLPAPGAPAAGAWRRKEVEQWCTSYGSRVSRHKGSKIQLHKSFQWHAMKQQRHQSSFRFTGGCIASVAQPIHTCANNTSCSIACEPRSPVLGSSNALHPSSAPPPHRFRLSSGKGMCCSVVGPTPSSARSTPSSLSSPV